MSAEPADLVELLRLRADAQPDALAYVFDDGDGHETPASYAWMDRRARAVAAAITATGIGPGERVLLMFAPGQDYVIGFFACLYAGVVAVPVYPPQGNRGLERIGAVFFDCTPSAILSTSDIVAAAGERVAGMGLRWLATDTIGDDAADEWSPSTYTPGGLAFLQYTSGSTASPKGVMVTHANLMHNTAVIGQACELGPDTVGVSWLPPYHDMGLIGGVLSPLRGGFPCVLMPPAAFLFKPLRWLEAISRHGATISAAPDFAYSECVRRISAEERATLDLSRWAHALVGAETVRPATLRAFTETFASCGLPPTSLYPCYGLAEATLFVTGGTSGEAARILSVDREQIAAGTLVTVADGAGAALTGCGHPHGPDDIRIVDPDAGTLCADGQVGEIWVSGPTVADGYWNAEEASQPVFHARLANDDHDYLRTGDLGFRHDGDLVVTGRVKDLMVVRGRNHHPQDIELAAEGAHVLLRPHRGAAFAVDGDIGVVLVHEVTREFKAPDAPAVQAAVRAAVMAEHGLRLHDVALVRGGAIPRTSSGKIRRAACRDAYLEGSLAPAAPSAPDEPTPDPVVGQITGVVARVLRVSGLDLDLDATLVAQGLDSLTAFELRAALLTEIGLDVGLDELIGSLTVGELVARVPAAASAAGPLAVEPELAEPEGGDVASFGQQRMWLLDRAQPGSSAYNVGAGVRVTGAFDAEAFAECMREVQARHAALRTTIVLDDDGVLRQRVHAGATIVIEPVVIEGTGAPLASFATEFVCRPFDLATEPPIRVAVVSVGPSEQHVLVAAHHLICDAASLQIVFTEVAAFYRARRAGSHSPTFGEPPQYPQWARAQRAALTEERLAPDLTYWRDQLGGASALRLPGPTPDGPVAAITAPRASLTLSPELSTRVRDLARATGGTSFMVLAAAFAGVLTRWTGQSDVVVATPLAGRDGPEATQLVGFLANTVGLRIRIDAHDDFTALLANTRRTALDAYAHGRAPWEKVVEAAQPDRSDGRQPVAQAMLALRRLPPSVDLGDGVTASAYEIPAADAQFDLALHLNEHDDGHIDGFALARPDTMAGDDVARLVEAYVSLLTGALDTPDAPVASLAIQTSEARMRTVSSLSRGSIVDTPDACLHQLVEHQVDAAPDAVAVVIDDIEITYAELDARANRLAHLLIDRGIGAERLVGICVPRSVEMVVALLAVMKSGGCYVPLDPEYPRSRLEFMIADAAASVVLTTAEIVAGGLFDDVAATIIEVADGAAGYPSDRPDVDVTPDNLAYVIYTSGSTGQPKGAMNAHRGVVNRIRWGQRYFDLQPGEAVLQKTPLSFDVSGWELYWPLATGGRLVLARPGGHRDPEYLAELIRARDISTVQFVPSMLHAFLATPGLPACTGVLRRIICSGEALSPSLVAGCHDRLPGVALFNLYGPTEAAIEVTALDCSGDLHRVTIGRPIDNARTHVLDAAGEPTPVGVPGELYLGGVPVARGYWRRPALTAQRFVPDPFAYGARLYRTGDQARVCPDGAIDYLGRLDGQVKIRGVRIELGEISTALAGHPDVSAAAVDVRPGPGGIGRLIGYLVCPGAAPTVSELRRYLADRLPAAMTPTIYVSVDSLPVSPSGKLDRAALPDPERGGSDGYVAPRTPVEEIVAEIWAQVLGVDRVGVHDDFFELGGHSLLATQVLVRIRAAFGIEPALAELLSGRSTVERLAETIVLQQLTSTDADEVLALIATLDAPNDNHGWRR